MNEDTTRFNTHEQYLFIVHIINLFIGILLFGVFYLLKDVIDIRKSHQSFYH
ncbi:MAG: hypothetical protein UMR38_00250 [Candidatus Izemoplasma sp.]|nr:hypothetical protein [Candidatus Izemoplasma sp.]